MEKEREEKIHCEGHAVDEITLIELRETLHEEKEMSLLSSIFKALSDPSRLKIIYLLSKTSLCVCDIATVLGMTQSSISHHLKVLRDTRLVKFKREGKLAIYSLDDDHVLELFEQGLDHVKHK